jgi:hypothetical protein
VAGELGHLAVLKEQQPHRGGTTDCIQSQHSVAAAAVISSLPNQLQCFKSLLA